MRQPSAPSFPRLLRVWRRGLVELLMLLPIWLLPAVYFVPVRLQPIWLLMLPVLSLCGAGISLSIGPRWGRALAALIPSTLGSLPFADSAWYGTLLYAAAYLVVIRGMAAGFPGSKTADIPRYTFGMIIYGLGYAIFRQMPEWMPYMKLLTAAGAAALAILLFSLNRNLLQRETLSSDTKAVTVSAKGHNRWFVAAVLASTFTVTLIAGSSIGHLLWTFIRAILMWLFGGPHEPAPIVPETHRPAAAPPPLPPAGKQGWFGKLLDILFYLLGTLAVGAIVLFSIWVLIRRRQAILRRLQSVINRISAFLMRNAKVEADQGFIDVETDLFSWEPLERKLIGSWRRRFAGKNAERWSGIGDNRERVRFLYRQWLRRLTEEGYTPPPHLTPDEVWRDRSDQAPIRKNIRRSRTYGKDDAAAEGLIKLYYRARYGRFEITDEELEDAMPQQRAKPRSNESGD